MAALPWLLRDSASFFCGRLVGADALAVVDAEATFSPAAFVPGPAGILPLSFSYTPYIWRRLWLPIAADMAAWSLGSTLKH